MPWSSRSRYSPTERQFQSKPGGSSFHPASWPRNVARTSSFTGAYDSPSWPSTSVVTPCETFAKWSGSARTRRSECECMSMNPGASTSPSASIDRVPVSPSPIDEMTPSLMATSAR